jgi:hypothetical protein
MGSDQQQYQGISSGHLPFVISITAQGSGKLGQYEGDAQKNFRFLSDFGTKPCFRSFYHPFL